MYLMRKTQSTPLRHMFICQGNRTTLFSCPSVHISQPKQALSKMAMHLNEFNTIDSRGPTLILIERKYTVNIHNASCKELSNVEVINNHIKIFIIS